MTLPSAIMRDRAAEEQYMKQPPPALASNVIRRVRAYIDQDGDFIIDFENYNRKYSLLVVLSDHRKLGWKECQALAHCMQIAARGTEIDNDSFITLCNELDRKYASTKGPVVENGRLSFLVNPGPGSIKLEEGDVISHISVSFDKDRDLVFEAQTFSNRCYSVCLSLPTKNNYFFNEDCKAFIDILYFLETGDNVDMIIFLCALSILRKKYNFLRLGKDTLGKLRVIITASRVPNEEPLHPAIQKAIEKKQREVEAKKACNGGGVSTSAPGLPQCPYPGMRYTRALTQSGQAQVYAGVTDDGKRVAIKVFSGEEESAAETYRIELRMLLKMREHRNVIEVIQFFETPEPALVTRLIDGAGDMAEFIRRNGRIAPAEARRLAAELADGIAHLHQSGIVHRDLKPANVLLQKSQATGRLRPVIIDLGLGRALSKGVKVEETLMTMDQLVTTFSQTNISEKTDSTKGTLYWMAPEMIVRQEWSEKTDVFAFGVILWELLSGKTPYSHVQLKGPIDLLMRVSGGERPDIGAVRHAGSELRRVIQMCWATEPKDRPSISQIVDMLKGNDPVAIFNGLDTSGKKRLNFGQFVQFLEKYAPSVPPSDMYGIFQAIDIDSSGDITLAEFLRFWKTVQSKGMESAIAFAQRSRRAG